MKISELENAPQWLKDAEVYNEDVEIIDDVVFWQDGVWKRGVWKDGVWEGGFWKDGVWEGGFWEGGVWEGGVWKGGIMWSNIDQKYIRIKEWDGNKFIPA